MPEPFLEQIRIDAFDAANVPHDGDLRLTALLQNRLPTVKQATQGQKLLIKATALGFLHPVLDEERLARLRDTVESLDS